MHDNAFRRGVVDVRGDFFLLSYGKLGDSEKLRPVAIVGKTDGAGGCFSLELVDGASGEARDAVMADLQFFLVDKGEVDPWGYAAYHCSTAANIYSSVHWGYWPKGYAASEWPDLLPSGLRARFEGARRISGME